MSMGSNRAARGRAAVGDVCARGDRRPPAASPFRAAAGLLGLLGLVSACTGGGDGDEGSSGQTLEEGQSIGELQLELPAMDVFTLRGTFPVPPKTFPRPDGKQPFGVVDADGQTYGAQAEVVSRYPKSSDGADVVEVVARVTRPAELPPGTKTTYRFVVAPHAPPSGTALPSLDALKNGPSSVPSSVKSLLSNPTGVVYRSHDVFGNEYVAPPFFGAGAKYLTRYGTHTAELKLFHIMGPPEPVPGPTGTLPHWLSVHTYAATTSGEEIVGLDIRVSNGHSGKDESLPHDDPLGLVYFRDFEIVVPNGWTVVQDYEDPFFGSPYVEGGSTVHPIVRPISGGKMHVVPWLAQFHRRLAICKVGKEARARAYLRGAGLGFNRQGTDPIDGHTYWSWWNPSTARYFPQRYLLPRLDHVGLAQVESAISSQLSQARGHLENGTGTGSYPYIAGALGWAHPYGTSYGGMTGGAEIQMFDGVETAWAASTAGYRLARIVHRMHTERQPNVLYDIDGEPSSVEGWVVNEGEPGAYVPFFHFITPSASGNDPFGLSDAPTFQVDHVVANGLQPDYQSELLSFQAHDYQHFIRYTRNAKVLAWLANDSVAKDDLRAQAETFRLSYHQYFNSASQLVQSSGLRWDQDFVAQHPGKGFGFGRGEAWGLDVACAAYATAPPFWRLMRRPWFDLVAEVLADGQGACNGFVQAQVTSKFVDGNYRARQAIEHVITENALLALWKTVYEGESSSYSAMVKDVLRDSFYALISDMSWSPGQSGPWAITAVGPLDPFASVFCNGSQIPADGLAPWHETFQNWSSFAYAFDLTKDTTFLTFATTQIGGGDLLTKLEAKGLDNLGNRAGLLARMQELNGDM